MAHLQFTDVQDRPTEFLDVTSLTLDEFQQLVPPFEAAFQAPMAAWRLDGKPRTARQFSVDKNCPLPTPEDRLFFIPTVCLDVIALMASSCGYDNGQIEQRVAHSMERLRNGQNTTLNSTRSPSRMCGSVKACVPC